jgi:hypothetical protein
VRTTRPQACAPAGMYLTHGEKGEDVSTGK